MLTSPLSLPTVSLGDGQPTIPAYNEANLERDLKIVGRNHIADQITGGLAYPSKMPCPSWGISALRCQTGSQLATVTGSTCEACYARKNRYLMPSVQKKLEDRYLGLLHELWTPAMCYLVAYHTDRYFRLMDSGDIQGHSHLHNLCVVARYLPTVLFWLPTREVDLVRSFDEPIPENLIVRLSAAMVDGVPPDWPQTSTVGTDGLDSPVEDSFLCPALEQDRKCQNCRACWDKDHPNVHYTLH